MLHFDYLTPGTRLDLPEVAGHLNVQSPEFEILATHLGGMGVCLELRSISNLESYALKCIHPELLGDDDTLNRFRDELDVWISASACDAIAEAIAIVRMNDVPSVLAKWMDGGDLTHVLSKLTPALKFETVVRVLRALQWAQTKLGVVHRDLKPTNILFDSAMIAYVADWGLARPLRNVLQRTNNESDLTHIDRPDRTQRGRFIGTVTHAAPEQIVNAATVDHRADIYALGCIMFELETGAPPFTGSSFQEIAYKHLHVTPPKLGGLFRQTILGLERVIDRCLAKDVNARYPTYGELERDLLAAARKRNFALDRCIVSERYSRTQLGKGHVVQQKTIENAQIKGKDVTLLDLRDIAPYLEESQNLMALGRYKEAEVLLRPHYIPSLISGSASWHFAHMCAMNYAFCLQQIAGRLDEALKIYEDLNQVQEMPAEFYVNYSLALNSAGRASDAKRLCQRGLIHFPDDIDLLGNYTISLIGCGDIEEAEKTAMRRLAMRRDVHSLEEAASVLSVQRKRLRDIDLPQAISIAEREYTLIKEGLSLNPRFPTLLVKEIQFLLFACARDKGLDAYQEIMDDKDIHIVYRQLAFLEIVEDIGESKHFKTALEMIDKVEKQDSFATGFQTGKERLFFTKYKIYAERYMIGKHNEAGGRILVREVVDYFLEKKGETYPYPVMTARVLEWMGRVEEAEELIRGAIKSWLM